MPISGLPYPNTLPRGVRTPCWTYSALSQNGAIYLATLSSVKRFFLTNCRWLECTFERLLLQSSHENMELINRKIKTWQHRQRHIKIVEYNHKIKRIIHIYNSFLELCSFSSSMKFKQNKIKLLNCIPLFKGWRMDASQTLRKNTNP